MYFCNYIGKLNSMTEQNAMVKESEKSFRMVFLVKE